MSDVESVASGNDGSKTSKAGKGDSKGIKSGNDGSKTSKAGKGDSKGIKSGNDGSKRDKSGNDDSKANKTGGNVKKGGKSATSGGGTGGVKVTAHRNIPIQYPMLTDTNYGVWAVKMKIILRTLRVWQAVTDDDVDDECDEGAMAAIAQSVPDSVLMTLAEYETTREAWNALKEMRIGEDRVTKARAQVLKRQLHKLQMEETESVNDYAMRLTTLVGEIRVLGAKLDEVEIVEKFFGSVTDKFTYIIGTLEQITDIESMTITEAIGRLRTWEENARGCRKGNGRGGDQLLYSRREWETPSSNGRRNDGKGSSNTKGDGYIRKGKGKGKPQGSGKAGRSIEQEPQNFDMLKVKCYNCNEMGHFARDCPKPNKREIKANLATQEDDNSGLLMAAVCEIVNTVVAKPTREVLLHEKKVVPKLSGNQNVSWYLDTGASNHMTGCKEKFLDLEYDVKGSVKFGDGSTVEICGQGSVLFMGLNGEHRTLTGVYYIPQLRSNIISIGQLDEIGCKVHIEYGVMTIFDKLRHVLVRVNRTRNRLYILTLYPTQPECWLVKSDDDSWLWHARFGHVNFYALKKMSKMEMVSGMAIIDHVDRVSDGGLVEKQPRKPFPAQSTYRSSNALELLHRHFWRPITPATHAGKTYFFLVVDDYSRYMWVVLLRSKDEAFEAFKKLKAATEMEHKMKVRALRTDRGGEFTSNEFNDYCEKIGMERFLMVPYTPQQNGVVERRNQPVVDMARSLLKSKNMPGVFWGEAVTTAVYLLNRAPTKAVIGKTPYEAIYGRKPSVSHLRTFGCVAHVKTTEPHLSKLADRSTKMVFIGYERNSGTKAYRFYDPRTKRLRVSRDVVFEEKQAWNWGSSNDDDAPNGNMFIVEFPDDDDAEEVVQVDGGMPNQGDHDGVNHHGADANDDAQGSQDSDNDAHDASGDLGGDNDNQDDGHGHDDEDANESASHETPSSSSNASTPAQFVSPPSQATDSSGPHRYKTLEELYEKAKPVTLEYSGLCLLGVEEPANFVEASKNPSWMHAMDEEIKAIESNGTWTDRKSTRLNSSHGYISYAVS